MKQQTKEETPNISSDSPANNQYNKQEKIKATEVCVYI